MFSAIKVLVIAAILWAAFYTSNSVMPTLSGNYAEYVYRAEELSKILGIFALGLSLIGMMALIDAISPHGQYVKVRRIK